MPTIDPRPSRARHSPPDGASAGAGREQEGHFGLRGMRERAADIGAALKVLSSDTGTSIIVSVPGRVAFWHDASMEPAEGLRTVRARDRRQPSNN
jgi:hypothetical protein